MLLVKPTRHPAFCYLFRLLILPLHEHTPLVALCRSNHRTVTRGLPGAKEPAYTRFGGRDARGRMDSSSQDDGHSGGRRSGRRPPPPAMKFMFIDSSSQGTNAKPNKAVRSFVMHQARRSKPWSTRQKNAESGPAEQLASAKRSPSQPHSRADEPSSGGPSPWEEVDSKPSAWNDWASHAFGSPVSSVGSTSTNSRAGSLPALTPPSSHGSVCDVPYCNGDSCGQAHTALARRDGFALGVLDPFDSLAVQMDSKTSSLLDHCKPTDSWRPLDAY